MQWNALIVGKLALGSVAMLIGMSGCVTKRPDTLVTPTPTQGTIFRVGDFNDQVTGVAVSRQGRIFVNFPRWGKEPYASVVELLPGGVLRPYPDLAWNSSIKDPGAGPQNRFICVQSVYVDATDSLWVVDPASPSFKGVVPGGAKLVKINLATDRVERVIRFDDTAAPRASYLNDVRVEASGDFAYLSDSGIGALVTVDLRSGAIRRLLGDHPSTKAEPGLVMVIEGRKLGVPGGLTPQIHVDGIALDVKGEYLYYHALTGRTLFRIPTRHLKDPTLSAAELGRRVERVALTGPTDGMEMDRNGNLYLTALEQNGILRYQPDGKLVPVIRNDLIQWPDSIAIASDGFIYFTASQINRMPRFNNGIDLRVPPYKLFRVAPLTP